MSADNAAVKHNWPGRRKREHRFEFEEVTMTAMVASILWRRLDVEGHDACVLWQTDGGHRLKGQAIVIQDGKPCCLAYEVDCDAGWHTRAERIDGFLGSASCAMRSKEFRRPVDAEW
jgi:hypothetical protein